MLKITGKCSTFGGPKDKGVTLDEGLAIYEVAHVETAHEGLFLKDEPKGIGLARRLNPEALYIACRWDYKVTPKDFLRGATCTVQNDKTGAFANGVHPVDWGPNVKTGRAMDLSPGLAKQLGLSTDDVAEMELREPGDEAEPEPAPRTTEDPPKATPPIFPHQSQAESYFGRIEVGPNGQPTERWEKRNLTTFTLPYRMRLAWDTERVIQKITCHKMVAPSLSVILKNILTHYGSEEAVRAARMDLYGGCYNYRLSRGGSTLSQHAYGAAIDLDPDRNGLGVPWKPDSGMMPVEVIQIFEDAGWTWGGKWSRPDAMHFQLLRA